MSEATMSDKADMVSKGLGELCNILKEPPEACNKDCITCRAGFAIFAFGSLLADVAKQKAELAEARKYIKALEDWADNPVTSTDPEGDYATFLSRRPGRATE